MTCCYCCCSTSCCRRIQQRCQTASQRLGLSCGSLCYLSTSFCQRAQSVDWKRQRVLFKTGNVLVTVVDYYVFRVSFIYLLLHLLLLIDVDVVVILLVVWWWWWGGGNIPTAESRWDAIVRGSWKNAGSCGRTGSRPEVGGAFKWP